MLSEAREDRNHFSRLVVIFVTLAMLEALAQLLRLRILNVKYVIQDVKIMFSYVFLALT